MSEGEGFRAEVVVEADGWDELIGGDAAAFCAEALACAAAYEGRHGRVAVLLTQDAALADLNGRFRGVAKPTNVLSFPAPEGFGAELGDIALGQETIAREALEQGKSPRHHTAHLTVHGFLHLLGYDHEDEAQADEMEARERAILARLGVPDPY